MSTGLPSRHALPDYLPVDALARALEARGLWRRAATRWQHLLLKATDNREAEALIQRQQYCLRHIPKKRAPACDGTAPDGGAAITMSGGLPNGADLWRTA